MNYKIVSVLFFLAVFWQRESFAQSNAESEIGSLQVIHPNGGINELAYCREIETDVDRLACYDELARAIPANEDNLKRGEERLPVIIKKVRPDYPDAAYKKLSENPLRTTSRVVQAIGASSVFHRVRRA